MPLGIDPTVDYAFKRLFGVPENSELLIHLLNAVLKTSSPIVEIQLLNPFNEKEFGSDKKSVLDIKARDGRGAWYNVEMQAQALGVLRWRLPYYNGLLYVDQLAEGEDYHRLLPAITVCFLDEVLFRESPAPHLKFTFCDCPNQVQLSSGMQIHTVELPKYNFKEQAMPTADPLVQWAFFLSHAAKYEAAELKRLLPARPYVKATGVMEMIGSTAEERALYESRRKAELDYRSFVTAARREALEEGFEEGREKGLEEGLEKGIEVGLEKGVEQGVRQGIEQGLEQGWRLGLIEQLRLLQTLLQVPQSTDAELQALPLDELSRQCDALKQRLLSGK